MMVKSRFPEIVILITITGNRDHGYRKSFISGFRSNRSRGTDLLILGHGSPDPLGELRGLLPKNWIPRVPKLGIST